MLKFLIFLKKKKKKKHQYQGDQYRNISEDQKQRPVEYIRNYYITYNK